MSDLTIKEVDQLQETGERVKTLILEKSPQEKFLDMVLSAGARVVGRTREIAPIALESLPGARKSGKEKVKLPERNLSQSKHVRFPDATTGVKDQHGAIYLIERTEFKTNTGKINEKTGEPIIHTKVSETLVRKRPKVKGKKNVRAARKARRLLRERLAGK
jgi:hypothetical protein